MGGSRPPVLKIVARSSAARKLGPVIVVMCWLLMTEVKTRYASQVSWSISVKLLKLLTRLGFGAYIRTACLAWFHLGLLGLR